MTIEKSQRLAWLDCCKGFAIICVVAGHIADGYINANMFPEHAKLLESIFNVIYLFHMPLFFCLSGMAFYLAYCRNRNRIKMTNQIANLLWLYVLFSVFLWGMKFIFSGSVNHEVSIEDLYMIPLKPIGEYWYLYALLFFYLLGWIVSKFQGALEHGMLGVACVLSCTTAFNGYHGIFPLNTILYYFVFFYIGMLLGKSETTGISILEDKKVAVMVIAAAVISATLTIYFRVNMSKVPICATICGAATALATICVFKKLRTLKVLQKVGTSSLDIYLMHTFITAANRKLLLKVGITSFYINILINFMMALCLPLFFSFLLKKLNVYSYIFKPVHGKKK